MEERISQDAMIALVINSKYSLSDQIALLRQKDEKPEEWEEFYEFAEGVKTAVKAEYAAYAEEDSAAEDEADTDTDTDTADTEDDA